MEYLLNEAVRMAIVTEKNSFDFYRTAAVMAHDDSVRRMCEQFADEEALHLEQFLRRYPGSADGRVAGTPCWLLPA
jgi:rubrerythrin